jgi:hypothetical protein
MSSTRQGERRGIWIGLVFAGLLTLLAFVSVGCVSAATTRYVNPGDSIQDVVDVADPGDTVIVRDGTYTENVEVNLENLTLRSENGSAFTTVVAAINTSDVFLVTANSVTIKDSPFETQPIRQVVYTLTPLFTVPSQVITLRETTTALKCILQTVTR